MYGKNTVKTVVMVVGLLFLAGSGCSKKDKAAKLEAARLKVELEAKQKELDCKVKVLEKVCPSGDTACETKKAEDLAACNVKPAGSDGSATATSTNTNTGTTN